MKRLMLLLSIIIIACSFVSPGKKDAESVLRDMFKKYSGKWYKSFSFNQTTENYVNDSLVRTSTWYENIVFPHQFRIDFGDAANGNAAIYLKDSVYSFRKGKLVRTDFNDLDITFLLGGMYFYSFDDAKAKLKTQGFDLAKFHENKMNGIPVYVIGASSADEKTSQVWIDQEKLVVVKFIRYEAGKKEEGIFGAQQQFGDAWSETVVDFYINDKLVQKEKYHDCKANVDIDPAIFDPVNFVFRKP